jgi:hypothetical protein
MAKFKCTCDHKYQDKKYGKRVRIFTEGGEKGRRKYSCTVCGKEKKL